MKLFIILSLMFTNLCACAPDKNQTEAKPAFRIADDARQALDKAKTVEATLQQATEQQKQAIEAQMNGDPPPQP
jgi:outer membrane lipoprotein-sorting protein